MPGRLSSFNSVPAGEAGGQPRPQAAAPAASATPARQQASPEPAIDEDALESARQPIGVVLDIAGSGSGIALDLERLNECMDHPDPSIALAGQVGSQIKIRTRDGWLLASIRYPHCATANASFAARVCQFRSVSPSTISKSPNDPLPKTRGLSSFGMKAAARKSPFTALSNAGARKGPDSFSPSGAGRRPERNRTSTSPASSALRAFHLCGCFLLPQAGWQAVRRASSSDSRTAIQE